MSNRLSRMFQLPITGLLLGAALVLTGCRSDQAPASPPAGAVQGQPEASAPAAPVQMRKVNLGIGVSVSSLNVHVGLQADTYRAYGIEVEAVNTGSSQIAMTSMVAGELQIAALSPIPAITSVAAGSDLVIISGFIRKAPMEVWVRKEIQQPRDLIGKTLVIQRQGDSSHAITLAFLKKVGISPSDVNLIGGGGSAARVASLVSGQVDGGAIDGLYTGPLRESPDVRLMLDMKTEDAPFMWNSVVTTRSLIQRDRAVVVDFMRGFVESIFKTKADPVYATKVLQDYSKIDDDAQLKESYDQFGKQFLASIPYVDRGTVETIIKMEEDTGTIPVGSVTPEMVHDNSIVQELVDKGFIEQMRKKYDVKD